jgi:hypothetical protein
MTIRNAASAVLLAHGFVASGIDAPFKRARSEQFDRPSPSDPHLIECVDIERDDVDRDHYKISAFISLASAYDLPAFQLLISRRLLHADGMFYPGQRTGQRLFSQNEGDQLKVAVESILLPGFLEQANVVLLRDLYLYMGGYKLKDRNLERFKSFGLIPSRRHLRHPRVLMVLEGILGDMKRALQFLNEHGVVGPGWVEFEFDPSEVSNEDRKRLSAFEIFEKYNKPKAGEHWTLRAKREIENGMFSTAMAKDVLSRYRRLELPCGYQSL